MIKETLIYIRSNLIDSDNNMYLIVDSLIDINNTITSQNITLRKVNVKPYGCDKMYMNKDLMEDEKIIIIDIFILHYSTIYMSSIRNGDISTFWAQTIAPKIEEIG